MSNCNPCRTPSETFFKLSVSFGALVTDPSLYRSFGDALQYLTFTGPDIYYVVQHVCLFMLDPRAPHLAALKRILRYLKGTLDHANCWLICIAHMCMLLLSTVTMSRLSISQLIWFIISVPSMWRLMFISFVIKMPLAMFVCSTSHSLFSLRMTKGLPSALFLEFVSSLHVRPPSILTAGAC